MFFNLFLNKVKPKVSSETEILRLLSKTPISRCSGCCPRNVPDSTREKLVSKILCRQSKKIQ